MENEYKMTKKDIAILIVFTILVIIDIKFLTYQNESINAGVIIERIILLILSFSTFVDISSYTNLYYFVPDYINFAKQKKQNEEIRKIVDSMVEVDFNFLQDYSEEKINFILSQLGITTNQFKKIKLELIKMRCLPLKSIQDAQEKIKSLCRCDYPIIIDQSKIDSAKICYNKVKYYINTMDVMFIPQFASELSSILSFLINEKLQLQTFDQLVIPHDSNFLLGVEVGKKLGKSVVKLRKDKGKIETEKCWDGNLKDGDKVIIIHDILVSGDQIIETLNKLPKTCEIIGLFCLITRTEWAGKELLMKRGISCYEVLEINDEEIGRLREEK